MGSGYKTQRTGFDKLEERLAKAEARLRAIEGAAPNRNSAISSGGQMTFRDVSGNQVVKLGHDSAGRRGLAASSPAGVDMIDFSVDGTGFVTLALNDPSGLQAFQVDTLGNGSGIRWPWLSFGLAPMTIALWPFNTSGSFVTVAQGFTMVFSQKIWVGARIVCDGGATAGQARMLVNGTQVGSTATIGTGAAEATFGPSAVVDTVQSSAFVEIQTRVTAGAGNARCMPYYAMWVNF